MLVLVYMYFLVADSPWSLFHYWRVSKIYLSHTRGRNVVSFFKLKGVKVYQLITKCNWCYKINPVGKPLKIQNLNFSNNNNDKMIIYIIIVILE